MIESTTSISGYFFKEDKNINLNRYMHPYVHCSIVYNSYIQKQPKCPSIDEWLRKMYVCAMEYYPAIKKKE